MINDLMYGGPLVVNFDEETGGIVIDTSLIDEEWVNTPHDFEADENMRILMEAGIDLDDVLRTRGNVLRGAGGIDGVTGYNV